jgi:NSS family neurotransmitter:Na+ symporter
MDLVFGNIVLAVGALAICLFISYVWKVKNALKEIASGNERFRLKSLWIFSVKYLAPVVIIIILIFIRKLTG